MKEIVQLLSMDIKRYSFEKESVDTSHLNIGGRKTCPPQPLQLRVKKSSIKNRYKTIFEITEILNDMNVGLETQNRSCFLCE